LVIFLAAALRNQFAECDTRDRGSFRFADSGEYILKKLKTYKAPISVSTGPIKFVLAFSWRLASKAVGIMVLIKRFGLF